MYTTLEGSRPLEPEQATPCYTAVAHITCTAHVLPSGYSNPATTTTRSHLTLDATRTTPQALPQQPDSASTSSTFAAYQDGPAEGTEGHRGASLSQCCCSHTPTQLMHTIRQSSYVDLNLWPWPTLGSSRHHSNRVGSRLGNTRH